MWPFAKLLWTLVYINQPYFPELVNGESGSPKRTSGINEKENLLAGRFSCYRTNSVDA